MAVSLLIRVRLLADVPGHDRVMGQVANADRDGRIDMELARGDRIRLRAALHEQGLYNGSVVTIDAVRNVADAGDDAVAEITARTEETAGR